MTKDNLSDMTSYTVADIALEFPQAIRILRRYDLDYCCQGKKPFISACQKARLDSMRIWQEIQAELPYPGTPQRIHFQSWEPNLLMDYIIQNHHHYVRMSIPPIKDLLHITSQLYGDKLPELEDIHFNFNILADELLEHLPKEEEVLFPAIRRILSGSPLVLSSITRNIVASMRVMEIEHDRAGELMKLIRTTTNYFRPSSNACPTLQMLYRMLEEFDQDLVQHIHIENNVLFEKIKGEL